MPRRKKTAYERRRDAMERAQKKALSEISRLEAEGYVFPEKQKKFISRYIGKKPTPASFNRFREATNIRTVRRLGVREIRIPQGPDSPDAIIRTGTENESATTHYKRFARSMVNSLKYSMWQGRHKKTNAEYIARVLRDMEKTTGINLLHGASITKASKDMRKTLSRIRQKDLALAFQLWDDAMPKGAKSHEVFTPVFQSGGTSPEQVARIKKREITQAKSTLKARMSIGQLNFKDDKGYVVDTVLKPQRAMSLSDDDIDRLYDFFDTDIWAQYRKDKYKYNPEDVYALADEIRRDPNIDIDRFMNGLQGALNMEEAIQRYRDGGNKDEN